MSRSFIAGSVAGLALSVAGLATVSLVAPVGDHQDEVTLAETQAPEGGTEATVPATEGAAEAATTTAPEPASAPPAETPPDTEAETEPATAMLDAPQGSEFSRPKEDGTAAVPEADAAPAEAEDAPAAPPVATVAEPSPGAIDTAPADQPDTQVMSPPPAVAQAPVETEAAPVPPAAAVESAPATNLPALAQVEPAKEPARVSGAGEQGGAPMAESLPDMASVTEPAPVTPKGGSEPPPEPADAAAITLPSPDESPMSEDTASADKPRVLTLDPAAPAPEEEQSLPGGTVPGVTILRLPGTDAPVAGSTAEADPATEKAAATPLRAFAARWQNADQRPVLAVLILDKGVEAGGLDPSALAALPFAVTIAVDPMRADAAAAAAAYRAAGDEVAILIGNTPEGATPADFEVAYQSFVQTLPESVAVIGEAESAFLRSSLGAQHMAALLAADGRGLVTYAQGLNPGRRAAEKAGVPVASVDKVFGAGEVNMGTLARELDRAAFAAGQSGQLVIALPSTPDAITAFAAWASGPAGSAVSVAPVSALMADPKGQ
ncbi:MAG TPA: divergent polysaccharide deacetylase family protein [Paracoccaceae bacterium]|nr:divergent polysaccharide deacetylase family protein [Paracoccaceae bacterium]